MPKSTQPARTVRDIKTLAGKAADLMSPHKMYMRLFSLETERHRRMQERESAMLRVTNIDARCAEIDVEKELLLARLGVESIPLTMPGDLPDGSRSTSARSSRGVSRPDPRRARPRVDQPTPGTEAVISEPVRIRY
ncbi:hypothetical protein [uncultured Thiodictyon sp.]|uniref:hypothetical protein n=1 Tax=uncultured Thiodictyon sp. TaxID=1846217 RepID=UPI0025E46009|nr:hypothetical protein [uncultured Thiodictyon sp.]